MDHAPVRCRSISEAYIGIVMSTTADHQWMYVDVTYPEYSRMTSRSDDVSKKCMIVREDGNTNEWIMEAESCTRSLKTICQQTKGTLNVDVIALRAVRAR